MTTVLQIGRRTISASEVIPLLGSYQMLPQLLRESIIDEAIANITYTPEEFSSIQELFYQQNQLNSFESKQAWRSRYCMNQELLELALIQRMLKIEKFKEATWGNKLESYFLQRKKQLDKVIYSVIQIKDQGLASELYFRIQEGEQTFSSAASEYSQGAEAVCGGMKGPVELGTLHPKLEKMLSISQVGQLWTPITLGEWLLIIRLEKIIPAQLNNIMRQRLLRELFEAWLQEQMNQVSFSGE